MDQADICTPDQEATTAQPFICFCIRQNQGERHCEFNDAVLPSAQHSAWLLQHYRQGKHRQWQQAGWKQDNRFIWQYRFLNEQQPPEELHPDMPKPSVLMKALKEQRATCWVLLVQTWVHGTTESRCPHNADWYFSIPSPGSPQTDGEGCTASISCLGPKELRGEDWEEVSVKESSGMAQS